MWQWVSLPVPKYPGGRPVPYGILRPSPAVWYFSLQSSGLLLPVCGICVKLLVERSALHFLPNNQNRHGGKKNTGSAVSIN
jgi:hypothetical protein